jgi:D-3-phosphoglycerate dehydrogenase
VASSLDLLTSGVLKGVLSRLLPDPVNLVNARFLAREMGLVVREIRDEAGKDFVNLLKVRYEVEKEMIEVEGTVFGSSTIRLVKMDGFRIEVKPSGCLLVYNNIDRPGILAQVGSVLAEANVNIAGVSLGRSSVGGSALTVMDIDGGIPKDVVDRLRLLEGLSKVRVVELGLDYK